MNIPVTDKFWCKCKFDENFNEVSCVDNKGTSFEYIDPAKGYLKFYKNNDIDISQELLDNIHNIKSNDKDEQLFIKCFSNLILFNKIKSYPNSLFFKNKIDNQILVQYELKSRNIWINYDKIWLKFESGKQDQYDQIRAFIRNMLERVLKLVDTTPYKKHLSYYIELVNNVNNFIL